MRTTLGYPASGLVPAAAVFALDAVSNHAGSSNLPSANPYTWTHTPVGIPKGIVVFALTEVSTISRVNSVTYGGVTMTALPLSPVLSTGFNSGTQSCVVQGWRLTSSVPVGAQTISMALTGITGYGSLNAAAISLVGPNDTAVEDTSVSDDVTGANPTCALTIANESFVCGALMSGVITNAEVVTPAGYTSILQVDVGSVNANFAYKNALTSTNSSMNWTVASAEYSILAAAIKST